MAKLDRLLTLVNALSDSAEGLTLDEMAETIEADRRTAERLRDVIRMHFTLEEFSDDRRKRFRISGSLRRVFTRPNAAEIAALEDTANAVRQSGSAEAYLLESLLQKIKGAMDDREMRRLDPDLEPLARLQRRYVPAGPMFEIDPDVLAQIQGAIMAGSCVEFDYQKDESAEANWREVIPFGLIHGPVTYLVGQIPESDREPVPYRLDRMSEVRISNQQGCAPDGWDIDEWMGQSFGIWREEGQEIVLHVSADAADRARSWRFHPMQQYEELSGGELLVRFYSGGLRELADHIFTWGGDVVILQPKDLRKVMEERLKDGQRSLIQSGPELSFQAARKEA